MINEKKQQLIELLKDEDLLDSELYELLQKHRYSVCRVIGKRVDEKLAKSMLDKAQAGKPKVSKTIDGIVKENQS